MLSNKILILGKIGWQCEQITAASWSGNTCRPTITQPIALIRLLFACYQDKQYTYYLEKLVTISNRQNMEAKNVYKNRYADTARKFNGFFKLMCVWKGSVIKLIYHDLAMFLILYGCLSLMYRIVLIRHEPAGEYFELLCIYSSK